MLIDLNPVVLSLGPLAVRWFGLLALVGLAAGAWLSLRLAAEAGVPRRVVLDVLAWAVPAGILGAHLVHVLSWWDYYLTHSGELWRLDSYRLSAWGGLAVGGLISLARLRGGNVVDRRRLLDAAAAGVTVAMVTASAGAFIEGVGQGVPTDLPWATRYVHPLSAAPDVGIGRHPVQVYDALASVLAFGLSTALARASPHRASPGVRGALFLALSAASRVIIGPLVLESSFLFDLQLEQMVAGACLLAALVGLWRIVRGQRRLRTAAATAAPGPESLAA
jgi:phosphatidylglycerol---prolipoprotein diacylglyceryl transferase